MNARDSSSFMTYAKLARMQESSRSVAGLEGEAWKGKAWKERTLLDPAIRANVGSLKDLITVAPVLECGTRGFLITMTILYQFFVVYTLEVFRTFAIFPLICS